MNDCIIFFFFQAEDGIRDLVRSRGLGDVYKRQVHPVDVSVKIKRAEPFATPVTIPALLTTATEGLVLDQMPPVAGDKVVVAPVSYTHLTLPTSDLV